MAAALQHKHLVLDQRKIDAVKRNSELHRNKRPSE